MDWVKAVEQIGITGVIILFIGLCVAWLGRRLLGENGMLTKVADRHVAFVDRTEDLMDESLKLQAKAVEVSVTMAETIAEAGEAHHQIRKQTKQFRRAAVVACDVLEKIASKLDVSVDQELKIIRSELGEQSDGIS